MDWESIENQEGRDQIILFPIVAAQPYPERTMAQREIQELLEPVIDGLPDAFRLVLVARAAVFSRLTFRGGGSNTILFAHQGSGARVFADAFCPRCRILRDRSIRRDGTAMTEGGL